MDNRDILEASASRRSSRASPEAIFENMNVSPADATHSPIINRPTTSTKAIEQRVSYQRSERSSGIDPLSVLAVLANAISLFDFSVKIHSLISRWREAPEYLRKLEDTIRNMESVLKIVGRTLKTMSATSLDPGDEKIFFTIVRNYTELVDELDEILRQSDRTGTSLDRLRRPLAKMMKERDIDNKISKIHLDLSQLTLVHTSLIWRELVEFKAAVDEFNRLLPNMAPPVYSGPPEDFTTPTTPAMPMGESSSESLFDLLIQDAPVDTNEERRPSLPDGIYNLEKRKLEEQVQELRENRMFFKAAQVQKEIVEMVESQVDVQLDPDICDPREQQADLLLDCYAPARHHEAAKILFDVLRRLKERAQTEVSLKRQGRLLSKLAKVFRDEDGLGILHDPGKSKLFFRSSLNSLSRMNPFPAEEFLAVGAAMVGFHEANSEFDQAKELENRIPRLMEQYCPGVQFKWSDYKNDSERSVLRWCRQQGFRANELSFRFDMEEHAFISAWKETRRKAFKLPPCFWIATRV
ncbi:hypothetical protein KJ359_002341 [Pestalotiopsis sp. 9143b]|nr:hypothetical protein KJ359_002341 [Pestalotiopsis sp. 9143b]